MTDCRIREGWIQTFTGKRFSVVDPSPDDVDIIDIAHALSMQCRFAGHVRWHYSVGQHSILVARVVERFQPDNRRLHLAALLHDASEAYLVDVPRPIKRLPDFVVYRDMEKRCEWAIREHFGLTCEVPDMLAIKAADEMLLRTECRDLMGPLHPDWTPALHPDHGTTMPEPIARLVPDDVEAMFIDEFVRLNGPVEVSRV